ncbi:MAG: hypothetical protein M3O67_04070, partial [Bacteroidota bacterium]|nr:hypothetical protein [Bacteroidota bacterium]
MIILKGPVIFLLIMLVSCNSNEIGNGKDVNPEAIYLDYKIWAEEGKPDVTILLQYRFGGPGGTTLVLEEPAKVELDGELISVDSTKLTGAFYEIQKPVRDFVGKHTLIYTAIDKKEYKEEFNFKTFSLKNNLPDTLYRNQLVFELKGLDTV